MQGDSLGTLSSVPLSMKLDLLSPFGKKKRNVTDEKGSSDIDQVVAPGDSRDSDLDTTSDRMNSQTKESGGLGVFDDSDHDEIFDDDDEDDLAVDQNEGTPLDISDLLAAGASAIVAPMQKVIHKDEDIKAGTSEGNSSDGDSDVNDTDSDDDEDDEKNSGHGSDSGEDYTDDEDEGEEGYKPGGYHRVKAGEVYNQRYVPVLERGSRE